MLAILEEPAVRERVHSISVPEYHLMTAGRSLPENVELIRGTLFEKMSRSPLHGSIVELLRDYLEAEVPAGCIVRQEKPLTLADSEPEPDLAIIRGARREFLSDHPRIALLLIEVCVSSAALDRIKLELYAEAGVPECWLVLAEERIVERHTEPSGAAYTRIERLVFPAALESTVLPGLTLPPADLFPG